MISPQSVEGRTMSSLLCLLGKEGMKVGVVGSCIY